MCLRVRATNGCARCCAVGKTAALPPLESRIEVTTRWTADLDDPSSSFPSPYSCPGHLARFLSAREHRLPRCPRDSDRDGQINKETMFPKGALPVTGTAARRLDPRCGAFPALPCVCVSVSAASCYLLSPFHGPIRPSTRRRACHISA